MTKPRFKKILVWAFTGLAVLSIAAVLAISLKVGWSLTHPQRVHVNVPAAGGYHNIQDVSFTGRRGGIVLRGWFLPAGNSDKTIIFAHGYGKNRLQDDVPALDIAGGLNNSGYNVLMFDFRGCGESGGDFTSVGQFEKDDLISAVDFVKKMGRPGEHVGLLGFSMGAVTSITAAAEDARIEAVVADAPFADLEGYLKENLPVWSGLPSFPFTPVILNSMPVVLGLDPQSVSPVKAVGRIKAPLLLIHGASDTTIPAANSKEIYWAAKGPKTLWIVPGAEHVGSYRVRPGEYMNRILALFAQMK